MDPTPGRAPPGAQDWLNVPEAQDTTGGDGTTATTVPSDQVTPGGGGPTPTRPGPLDDNRAETAAPESTETPQSGDDGPPFIDPLKKAAAPAGITVLAYLLLVPLALVGKRLLRRQRARSPGERVSLAWLETNERLAFAGLQMAASLTVAERAARMRLAFPSTAEPIDLLARSIERVTYGEVEPSEDEATRVEVASAEIRAAAVRRVPWRRRVLAYVDIRRLLPEPDRARRTAHGAQRTHVPASGSGSFAAINPQR
jgi:hypothetical protein